MNKIAIVTLAIMAALTLLPASAQHLRGDRTVFSVLDTNGDGMITKAEIQTYGTARFANIDIDGNGSLSRDELMLTITKWSNSLLKRLDTNGNGAVEQAEMQARLGGQRMIKFLDKNKDGMISRKELDASNE